MKDIKIEMPKEKDVQSRKEGTNQPKLKDKSKAEPKNIEEKIIKEDMNKNCFSDYNNISGKDSNYKGKKANIAKKIEISIKEIELMKKRMNIL